ncbi:aminopeptidase, partial [Paenibacillus polymyxa]|nr:aminopeptidase [Paenibacillus polymyxa]
ENILATADKPLDDREVATYLSGPDEDGGHYDQAAALIEKYGLVPKSVMPETYNSDKTAELNSVLNEKLRKDAKVLRTLKQDNASEEAIAKQKREFLSVVYRILAYTFG